MIRKATTSNNKKTKMETIKKYFANSTSLSLSSSIQDFEEFFGFNVRNRSSIDDIFESLEFFGISKFIIELLLSSEIIPSPLDLLDKELISPTVESYQSFLESLKLDLRFELLEESMIKLNRSSNSQIYKILHPEDSYNSVTSSFNQYLALANVHDFPNSRLKIEIEPSISPLFFQHLINRQSRNIKIDSFHLFKEFKSIFIPRYIDSTVFPRKNSNNHNILFAEVNTMHLLLLYLKQYINNQTAYNPLFTLFLYNKYSRLLYPLSMLLDPEKIDILDIHHLLNIEQTFSGIFLINYFMINDLIEPEKELIAMYIENLLPALKIYIYKLLETQIDNNTRNIPPRFRLSCLIYDTFRSYRDNTYNQLLYDLTERSAILYQSLKNDNHTNYTQAFFQLRQAIYLKYFKI
ncbi:hypothetical protein [Propionispora vibrioides]|uniref:Uncharacterized protein n=1 Tax=Propionispora vibrioides TaxID=112903 RepID=A0A1H8Y4D1_9FIRM|nr:hypothetical protein [Propionispora vibrioides]SEP46936.1 hypothetical protein SAMN04490178_1421 [Propionispora vibrioides]